MARHLDPGYESPSEQTTITKQSAQNMQTRKNLYPLHPQRWASYFKWASPRRYFVVVMAFLGFYNVYAVQVNLSVAMIGMTSPKAGLADNGSLIFEDPDVEWPEKTQEMVLDSFYYGYILSQIPGAYLASIYGPKKVFGICTVLEALLLSPFIYSKYNINALVGAVVIKGILQGVTFPSVYLILSKWIPTREKSKLATAVISGGYFGVFVTLPLANIIMEKYDWHIAAESFSLIASTWALLWLFIIFESPKMDPYISEDELNYIQSSVENSFLHDKMPLKVSWMKMLLSFPVWAIIVAHFCENWGFYTLLRVLPKFMDDVHSYSIYTDFSGSFPYLSMGITVLLGGFIASWLQDHQCLTTIQVRKIFTCGGFLGRAVFLLIAAHSYSKGWSLIYFTIALGLGGFAWSGFGVNHFDISPSYAGFLIGLSNTLATLPGIISPAITDLLVKGDKGDRDEWVYVFYVSSAIYIFGAIFYGIYGSSEEQSWSRTEAEPYQNAESQNMKDLPSEEPTYE